jgi:hypothetical protein
VDYDLTRLNWRSFEQLVQALASSFIAPGVGIFGDGPDGGREASYKGQVPYPSENEQWKGTIVVQAKFLQRPRSTKTDTEWALAQLESELTATFEKNSHRLKPTHYIFATNATLSSVPRSGGKAKANAIAKKFSLEGFDLWDYDRIRTYLDQDESIRKAYLGYICPGDVLAKVSEQLGDQAPDFDAVIANFLEKELLEDQYANLEQAGRVADERLPISRVFVDLPTSSKEGPDEIPREFIAETLATASERLDPETQRSDSLRQREPAGTALPGRLVLVGGPGQGKTTVGQYVCQLFRASLLNERPKHSLTVEATSAIELMESQCEEDDLPLPTVRRFPIRIPLTELSDHLAASTTHCTLIEFMVTRIATRTASEISPKVFRSWLSTYPWLLVLDGLDEVPASSNRDAVLKVIRDFWVDVTQANSDVLVLATTRPQGYNDDFSPNTYRHVSLAPLPPDRALHYGRKLALARYAGDEKRQAKVIGRLERAAHNAATAKLMTSPLQVTIMATLVDRVGQPPQERWKLFSEYYAVIYRRELERDIPAANILRNHQPDIDAIHRRVALVLQVEGERAQHAEARMSSERFASIVRQRLSEEGHEDEDLEELAKEIIRAAADRLVFLVGLESDELGFEIRSLQEFMAAEALMDAGEDHVARRLRAIAGVTSWRNVFLFAAGKCFAEKQHLRDTIHTICSELNDTIDDPLAQFLFPGSILATDLLRDGFARNQPRNSRLLAKQGLELLGDQSASHQLVDAYHPSLEAVYKPILEEAMAADGEEQSSSLTLLAVLADRRVDWAAELLDRSLTDGSLQIDTLLAAGTGDRESTRWLADRLQHDLPTIPFSTIERHRVLFNRRVKPSHPDPLFKLVARLVDFAGVEKMEVLPAGRPADQFAFTLSSIDQPFLGAAIPAPEIASLPAAWSGLAAAARFSNEPTAAQLAIQLREIAKLPPSEWTALGFHNPWPLRVLLESSRGDAERLLTMASLAEKGDLGDRSEWLNAERRWRREGITADDLDYTPANGAPFDRGVAERGFPIAIAGTSIHVDAAAEVRHFLVDLLGRIEAEPARKFLALRIVTFAEHDADTDKLPAADRYARSVSGIDMTEVANHCRRLVSGLRWNDHLSDVEIELIEAVGLRIGEFDSWSAYDHPDLRRPLPLALLNCWNENPTRPGCYRLLALLLETDFDLKGPDLVPPEGKLAEENPGATGLLMLKRSTGVGPHPEAFAAMAAVAAEEPIWLYEAMGVIEARANEPGAAESLDRAWEIIDSGVLPAESTPYFRRECQRLGVDLLHRRATKLEDPAVWKELALFKRPPSDSRTA